MEPSFKAITDLFEVPTGEDLEIVRSKHKSRGETPDESDELGRQSLNDGDVETAIKHFRDAVNRRSPEDITSRINLAGALDYSDNTTQAFRQYELAIRASTEAAEPRAGAADLYRRYGRFRDSIEKFEEATRLEPTNPFYFFKLSETLKEAGFPTRAILPAQNAIAIKPDDAYYHYWLGELLTALGRFDEALDAFRAAIELSPGDDYLYLRTTVAFWGAGRKPEAVKAIRLASDLDPSKNLYHALLGVLLEETDQLAEAALEADKTDKLDRYDEDLLARLMAEMKIEA